MKNPTKDKPYVNPKLVEFLKEAFPLSDLVKINTLEDLKFAQGQQSVIRFLVSIHTSQEKQKKILDNV